jgi:FKBP-type peptidyl-prolyl cis-trans isomerase
MTGLREGLKLMKSGEKVNFLFPSSRAYGFYGDKKRIGSDVPLKATVQLKSIKKTEQ